MHVYHYAAYERTALGRLAQRHATREEEVDRLLRGGVLVDLYRVVRQGIRASVESYSIKRLEPLYGLEREVELRSAGSSIVAFEAWLEGGCRERRRSARRSCARSRATTGTTSSATGGCATGSRPAGRSSRRGSASAVPRPPRDRRRRATEGARRARAARRRASSRRSRPASPDEPEATVGRRSTARWLLAQLLGWHRREDKAFWWRFFELAGMTDEELVDEREPLGRIELVADLERVGKGGVLQLFRFPLAGPRPQGRTGGHRSGGGHHDRDEARRDRPRDRRGRA